MTKREDALPEDLITLEMVESFIVETNDLLDATETDLLELEKNPENLNSINEAFCYVHTVKGNSGFYGYADIESHCIDLESLLELVREGSKHPDDKLITVLLGKIDSIRDSLRNLKYPDKNWPILKETQAESPKTIHQQQSKKPSIQNNGGKASPASEITSKEILVEESEETPGTLGEALKAQSSGGQVQLNGIDRKDIRVDMAKLDKLFNLIVELMTAEAIVVSHPELEGKELPNFQRAAGAMSKIVRDMQEIILAIRMVPLEGLFNKMRRLVRDLAEKFNKVINFGFTGQAAEMERNVIEEISDPLVHIIRNSIDHGIEDAFLRKERLKPAAGKISLDAKYEGNEIWITITDDGGGLKKDKILEKAAAGGFIIGTGEELSDEQVWNLIFEPGFSTADTVSEISGRGVGMDVVKRNIEKLGGKITVHSEQGIGTTIILKIPAAPAIFDVILFRVGEMTYALSLGDIVEFRKVKSMEVIKSGNRKEVLNFHSEIIPVIRVFEHFGIKTKCTEIPDGIIILVRSEGLKAALLADEIVGYRQMIKKPLPDIFKNVRAVSGCGIPGREDISLIIDTAGFLRENLG